MRIALDTNVLVYAEAANGALMGWLLGSCRCNPEKVEAMEKAGVQVVERVPCLADVVDTRLGYLRTKREKMGHLLEFDDL